MYELTDRYRDNIERVARHNHLPGLKIARAYGDLVVRRVAEMRASPRYQRTRAHELELDDLEDLARIMISSADKRITDSSHH